MAIVGLGHRVGHVGVGFHCMDLDSDLPAMIDRERWAQTRLRADMWWCGDYECDCTQPIIERIEPNRDVGYPATRIKRIWEGTYRSLGTAAEHRAQWGELYREARKYGIQLKSKTATEVAL